MGLALSLIVAARDLGLLLALLVVTRVVLDPLVWLLLGWAERSGIVWLEEAGHRVALFWVFTGAVVLQALGLAR